MDPKLQLRIQLEGEIKSAIAKGEIMPYYQPLVDLASQATIGYEMLARWEHPTKGVLPPELFIPIAEDTGTIGELTYSLLGRAVKDAAALSLVVGVSVGVTVYDPEETRDDSEFAVRDGSLVETTLRRADMAMYRAKMEGRRLEAKATLKALRNVGIRVALDDFGTGYAGLFHLRELKFDTIKIDRSFVTKMLDRPEEGKIGCASA
jgi:predicted signal transduction protein with EAL and GGDEF domain